MLCAKCRKLIAVEREVRKGNNIICENCAFPPFWKWLITRWWLWCITVIVVIVVILVILPKPSPPKRTIIS